MGVNKVYIRGFSKIPYNTLGYTASTNAFLASATTVGGLTSVDDIQFIDIPNAILVAYIEKS